MRIQNNVMAMNTHRMYTINNSNVAKSAERLSSGYRINRAGDDAAGLAISEKMRAQVRGLNMASKNSQDAVSLIQTAEGALQEVHSMLQRMNELANQAATGTNETFDREQINAEFNQLKEEINQIADTTTFNNMKLLDGSLASDAANVSVANVSTLKNGATLTSGAIGTTPSYTVTKHTGLSDQVGSYIIAEEGAGSGKVKITFTDDATGNQTNTIIDLNKVVTGDVANGKSFTVDLSEAGLGVYTMTADNSGAAGVADLAAALATGTVTTEAISEDAAATPAQIGAVGNARAGSVPAGAIGTVENATVNVHAGPASTHQVSIDLAGIAGANNPVVGSTYEIQFTGGTLSSTAVAAGDASLDAAGIAAKFNGQSVTIGSTTYTASVSGSELILTADTEGALDAADSLSGTFTVAINADGTTGQDIDPASTAVTLTQAGVTGVAGQEGYVDLTLNNVAGIEDGDKLSIGGKNFVFKTFGGAATAGAGEVLVELGELDATAEDVAAKLQAAITADGPIPGYTMSNEGGGVLRFTQSTAADATTEELEAIITNTDGAAASVESDQAGVAEVTEQTHQISVNLAGTEGAANATIGSTYSIDFGGGITLESAAIGAADGSLDAEGLAAKFNGQSVTVGSTTYTASVVGTTISLVAGTAGALDPADSISSLSYTFGYDTNASGEDLSPDATAVVETTPGVDAGTAIPGRVDLALDSANLADGAKIEVDGKTFVLRTPGGEAQAEAGEVLIQLNQADMASNTALASAVASAISAETLTNYNVSDLGNGSIRFAQAVAADVTVPELEGAISLTQGPARAGRVDLAMHAASVTDGAKIEVDGKTFVLQTPGGEAAAEAGEVLVSLSEADMASDTALASAVAAAISTEGLTNYDVTDNADGSITFTQITPSAITTGELEASITLAAGVDAPEEDAASATTNNGALKIQVGANEGEQLTISVASMNTKGLGIANSTIDDQTKAGSAITATQKAINLVSEQRATLGAMQNRLEHKIANLDNTSENLNAAESRIRDVDIAKEMTTYTKNNILSQAATAMLAQANAAPQGVLSLLQ